MKATVKSAHASLAEDNLAAATIILSDTPRYGGESLAAQWARLWLANHQGKGNAE